MMHFYYMTIYLRQKNVVCLRQRQDLYISCADRDSAQYAAASGLLMLMARYFSHFTPRTANYAPMIYDDMPLLHAAFYLV